jgi:hypothetical protein
MPESANEKKACLVYDYAIIVGSVVLFEKSGKQIANKIANVHSFATVKEFQF